MIITVIKFIYFSKQSKMNDQGIDYLKVEQKPVESFEIVDNATIKQRSSYYNREKRKLIHQQLNCENEITQLQNEIRKVNEKKRKLDKTMFDVTLYEDIEMSRKKKIIIDIDLLKKLCLETYNDEKLYNDILNDKQTFLFDKKVKIMRGKLVDKKKLLDDEETSDESSGFSSEEKYMSPNDILYEKYTCDDCKGYPKFIPVKNPQKVYRNVNFFYNANKNFKFDIFQWNKTKKHTFVSTECRRKDDYFMLIKIK